MAISPVLYFMVSFASTVREQLPAAVFDAAGDEDAAGADAVAAGVAALAAGEADWLAGGVWSVFCEQALKPSMAAPIRVK